MQSFDTDPKDNPDSQTKTYLVGPINILTPGTCRRFELPNGDELAIYNVSGEYYATDNFCPHRGAALSDGLVFGHIVECGWHGWRFDVRTGECLTVTEKIRTLKVRVVEGMLLVDVYSG
jgi:nitrite reductase (NADH) small subunit